MKIKKNISVVLNGQIPLDKSLIQRISSSDYIIAVDGSANQLNKLNILPNVVIGDFDSIESFNDSNVELIEANDQSKTDFRKTLEWCIKKNISHISIFGISGKSEDHFLGNFFAINDYYDAIEFKIYTDYSTITPCIGKTVFDSFKGETVSIVSFEMNNKVTSTNLKYPLDSYKLSPSTRAIRNQSLGSSFTIESSEKLMVFQIRD